MGACTTLQQLPWHRGSLFLVFLVTFLLSVIQLRTVQTIVPATHHISYNDDLSFTKIPTLENYTEAGRFSNCWLNPPWGTKFTVHQADANVCADSAENQRYTSAPTLTCPGDLPSFGSTNATTATTNTTMDFSKRITIVMIYYANPYQLIAQLKHFATFPPKLQQSIELVLIDDGSPPGLQAREYAPSNNASAAAMGLALASIRIVRIIPNIAWNIPGASNLGFYVASTERVLSLEIDTFVSVAVMEACMEVPLEISRAGIRFTYRFGLRPPSEIPANEERQLQPKVALTSKQTFWNAGGYDESFSSHYGHDDLVFWKRYSAFFLHKISEDRRLWVQLRGDPEGKCILLQDKNQEPQHLLYESCLVAEKNLPRPPKRSDIPRNKKLFKFRQSSGCWSNQYLRFPWTIDRTIGLVENG